MITQYRLKLQTEGGDLTREDAYHLYALLLEMAPADCRQALHESERTPFSQYLRTSGKETVWTVSLLGSEAESLLQNALETIRTFTLRTGNLNCLVKERVCFRIESYEALFSAGAANKGDWTLRFETPAVFKSRGAYVLLPSTHLILQSLLNKWNAAFPECPIEDEDGMGLAAMAEGLRVERYRLNSTVYRLKGNLIPGFEGSLTLHSLLQGFHRELADALLAFAPYCGLGAKTALGMGGISLVRNTV